MEKEWKPKPLEEYFSKDQNEWILTVCEGIMEDGRVVGYRKESGNLVISTVDEVRPMPKPKTELEEEAEVYAFGICNNIGSSREYLMTMHRAIKAYIAGAKRHDKVSTNPTYRQFVNKFLEIGKTGDMMHEQQAWKTFKYFLSLTEEKK